MRIGIDFGSRTSTVARRDPAGDVVLVSAADSQEVVETPSTAVESGQQLLVGSIVAELAGEGGARAEILRTELDTPAEAGPCESLSPVGLVAALLQKLERDAEESSLQSVDGAVVAVPTTFSERQRRRLIDAAALAGLPLLSLVEDPVAATYAYLESHALTDELLLVVDLGAQAVDLTIVRASSGEQPQEHSVRVVAAETILELGGDRLEAKLQAEVRREIEELLGTPVGAAFQLELERVVAELKRRWAGAEEPAEAVFGFFAGQAIVLESATSLVSGPHDVWLRELGRVLDDFVARSGLALTDLADLMCTGGYAELPGTRVVIEKAVLGERRGVARPQAALAAGGAASATARGAVLYAETLTEPAVEARAEILGGARFGLGVAAREPDGDVRCLPLIEEGAPLPARGVCSLYTAEPDQSSVTVELIRTRQHDSDVHVESLDAVQVEGLSPTSWSQAIEVELVYLAEGAIELTAKVSGGGEARLSLPSDHPALGTGSAGALLLQRARLERLSVLV